jgi:hypothetical protein
MRRFTLTTEDFVIGIKTRRGTFRIHLAGATEDLKAVGPLLDDIAGMASSPQEFLDSALPELARYDVTVVETFDIGPQAPSLDLVERVRLISRTSRLTSADSFIHLLVTFQAADPGEQEGLLQRPEDLNFVADYVNSVLDDLDEERPEAAGKLRDVLATEVAYVILGPSGG